MSNFTILKNHPRSLSDEDINKIMVVFKLIDGNVDIDGSGNTEIVGKDITKERFEKYIDNKELILTADLLGVKTGNFVIYENSAVSMPYSEEILKLCGKLIKTPGFRGEWNCFGCARGSDITLGLDKDGYLSLNLFHCNLNVSKKGWGNWFRGYKQVEVNYKNVHVRISPIFVSMYKLHSEQ
jgi:hypothetical protein